jgi:hypothetical protein
VKRHESDLVSLVFALIFLLAAALWPLWQLGALGSGTIDWLPATALVLIGLLGLGLSVTRSRSGARSREYDDPNASATTDLYDRARSGPCDDTANHTEPVEPPTVSS